LHPSFFLIVDTNQTASPKARSPFANGTFVTMNKFYSRHESGIRITFENAPTTANFLLSCSNSSSSDFQLSPDSLDFQLSFKKLAGEACPTQEVSDCPATLPDPLQIELTSFSFFQFLAIFCLIFMFALGLSTLNMLLVAKCKKRRLPQ